MDSKYNYYAIRTICDDECYKIGDICRNSYDWDMENDISGYYTGTALDGTCGTEVVDGDVDAAIKKHREMRYMGASIVLIGGDTAEFGNDDGEIIIADAEVVQYL